MRGQRLDFAEIMALSIEKPSAGSPANIQLLICIGLPGNRNNEMRKLIHSQIEATTYQFGNLNEHVLI